MKFKKNFFFLLLLLILPSCSKDKKKESLSFKNERTVSSENFGIRAKIALSKDKIALNERFFFRIRLEFNDQIQDDFKFLPHSFFGDSEEFYPPKTRLRYSGNSKYPWSREFLYSLEAIRPGKFEFPGFNIRLQKGKQKSKIFVPPQKFEVYSRFDATGDSLKTLRNADPSFVFFPLVLGGITGLMFLSAGIFFKLRRENTESKKTVAPKIDYWENIMAELNAIEPEKIFRPEEVEEFHIRLSSILRSFIENYLEQKAEYLTSEEFIHHLLKNQNWSDAQKTALEKLVKLSDIVKFAKFNPGKEVNVASLVQVKDFVIASKKENTP